MTRRTYFEAEQRRQRRIAVIRSIVGWIALILTAGLICLGAWTFVGLFFAMFG